MGYTARREARNAVVAIAHQSAFGTAASAAGTLVRATCLDAAFRRGAIYQDPQGTHGSEFPRDLDFEAATRPGARLRFYAGARAFLAAVLEHATHGQPTATGAAGDLLHTGEAAGTLSAWSLAGVRPTFNTDASNKLYVRLSVTGIGGVTKHVTLYSDSAYAASVASGSGTANSTITLTAQNSSGLSGSVAWGTGTPTDLSVLTVARVRPARAVAIARYFTLFRETGSELEAIQGCTVSRLRFASSDRGALVAEADIVGGAYAAPAASTLSPVDPTAQVFCHARAALTYNAVTETILELAHGIEHDVEACLANAAAPSAIWKRGSRCLPIEARMRFTSESRTAYDEGVAGTRRAVAVDYSYGTKHLTFTYPRCKVVRTELPAIGATGFDDHRLTLEARDNGTDDPVSIALDL